MKKRKKVSSTQEYEERLDLYKQQLDKALASEKHFISSISHEIRTPLNSIIGYLELLKSEEIPTRARGFADSAYVSAKHLYSLINDILDISKIEAGQLELNNNPLDLDDILLDCGVIVSSMVNKNVFLDIVLPRLDFLLVGDAMRIRQIFINLLGNASKFTTNGEIRLYLKELVESKPDEMLLTFVVEDSGVGIDEHKLVDLFKPFKQLHRANFEGTGLGLYLTRALLEKMNGSIKAESKLGVGSKFTFTMRLKKGERKVRDLELNGANIFLISDDESLDLLMQEVSALGATIKVVSPKRSGVAIYAEVERVLKGGFVPNLILLAQDEIGSKAEQIVSLLGDLAHNAKIVAIGSSELVDIGVDEVLKKPIFLSTIRKILNDRQLINRTNIDSYSKHRVLLVEDMDLNIELAKEMFKRYFEIDLNVAKCAEEAIWRVRKERFDLIFMDIQLPKMDGIEATRAIREFDKTTPIVALSANAFKEDIELAKSAGMNDYLTKPISKDSITNALKLYLSGTGKNSSAVRDKILAFFEREYSKTSAKRLAEIAENSIIEGVLDLKLLIVSPSNQDRMSRTIHRLKGIFLNSGLNDLARLLAKAEDEIKAGVMPRMEIVDRIVDVLEIDMEMV